VTPARWTTLVVALLLVAVAGVMLGTMKLPPGDVLRGLLGHGSLTDVAVVRTLRLPRVVLAMIVGAGLGAAGAALQGATRNGLAEPYLLGVSGGAAVGRAAGGQGDARIVLMAGVVVGAFANAAIMVALANAQDNVVRGALWWMMGSVSDASWPQVRIAALWVAVGILVLLALARAIDVLALGEDTAAGLGVRVARVSLSVYVAAALLAAGTVAAAGLVGFIGLLVPHLVRMAGARTHRTIIGAAALAGASLVVAADLIARVARPPAELPLGAVTALIGVPFFLTRLRRLA
jgi:iron complex transport system permease protein